MKVMKVMKVRGRAPASTAGRTGSVLLQVMVLTLVLSTLGATLLDATMSALLRSQHDLLRAQALDVGEAGIDKAVSYLRGAAPDASTDGSWRTTGRTESLSGAGSYTLVVADGSGDDAGRIVITSSGTATLGSKSLTRRFRCVITRTSETHSVWDNVIFAGSGQGGKSINGNVAIRGKVHLRGDGEPYIDSNGNGHYDAGEPYTDLNGSGSWDAPLASTDLACDMGGNSDIGNNYSGMSSTLKALIPACPTVSYGGETVQSLAAKLRVQHGKVSLSGSSTVGAANATGGIPAVKETMDGCYVTDGYTSGSAAAVYSDNGTSHGYDPADALTFPDVVTSTTIDGTTYSSHMAYLASHGLNIAGPLNLQPDQSYTAADLTGNSLTVNGATGLITIHGIVYVTGDINLDHGHGAGLDTFHYTGRGTLSSTGSIYMHASLLPLTSFPTLDALGFVARHRLELATGSGDSQLTMTGAFYGQEQVVSDKQNEIAGSFVSCSYSMQNVPHLYQVPALATNLPPGMPGAASQTSITTQIKSWREI
jgi:hypothetical protein